MVYNFSHFKIDKMKKELLGWLKNNCGFALLNFAVWYWNAFLNVVMLHILMHISLFILFLLMLYYLLFILYLL